MRFLSNTYGNKEKTEKQPSLLTEEAQAFFEQYLPSAALEVFPDWQGILLACDELAVSLWIVRNKHDGRQLHAATGQPALLLTDLLAQKGRNLAEAWRVLQPCLIFSHGEDEGSHEETEWKRTEEFN